MAKVSSWDKFTLLLWKNWVLLWNNKIQFVVELLLPVVFSFLLVLVRALVDAEPMGITTFDDVPINSLSLLNQKLSQAAGSTGYLKNLPYSPKNDYLEKIVSAAAQSLNISLGDAYPNAAKLQEAVYGTGSGNAISLAGVQFDDSWANLSDFPATMKFTLRFPSELRTSTSDVGQTWLTNKLFALLDLTGPRNSDDQDGGLPVGYLREGFLPVQNALSRAWLNLMAPDVVLPEVKMQRYPYPAYIYDPLLEGLSSIMALIILLSFIYPCTFITKNVTTEKEKQLKEVMKIMGLQNWIHWMAWFVKSFLTLAVSSVLIAVIMKIEWSDKVSVLTYSSWTALIVFLWVYVIASICFCFMMATFFSRASTAAAVTGLIWFISYVPYSFTFNTYDDLDLGSKLGMCLLQNSAMGLGFKLIMGFEGTGEGLQWSNMFSPVSVDDTLTVGYIILMMLGSSVIYMIICLYIEQIAPGDYGVPKKWYFPFTASFWCPSSEYGGVEDIPNGHIERNNPEAFEAEPRGKHVGLQIKNLKKKFGDKMAVRGVSLNMYEDEITVLLGHNGAGKTTTISMLTGMFPPTSGTAIINGSDIRKNIEGARMSLGICPQHNVLFDELTVANHIVFFSRLKGLKGEAVQREVDKYLKMIELENKANVASSKLSGGMKRKLSLCCALCGDTKVVLCDEPSSGMDPSARRQLWDLLQAEKPGRTILLTTHFMDEADVLGDRIAIMCDGVLKCHGTSFFLKKKYGSGYRLICVKRDDCNAARVTELLNRYIPDLTPECDIGAELSYSLPDNYSAAFEEMFAALEESSEQLSLNGYGISITTLEEVFMRVGSENASDGSRKNQQAIMNGGTGYEEHDAGVLQSTEKMFNESTQLLSGNDLMLNQWHAMFLKKYIYTLRNKLLFLLQNIMPIFFVIITIVIARSEGTFNTLPAISLSVTQYPQTVTVLHVDGGVASGSLAKNISEQYEAIASSYDANHEFKSTENETFSNYILELGKTIQVRINSRYVAAASITNNTITAWLNNQPLHTAALSVNLIYSSMAKAIIGSDSEVTVINYPLPFSKTSRFAQLDNGNNLGTQLATNLCFCMCFVSSFYILFLIKERESRSKLLQFVGGVNVWTFWLTQYLWDMLTFALTALIVVLTLACFQETGFATFSELGRVYALLLVFGLSVLPFTYLLSRMFTEPAIGFGRSSIINIFAGMALYIVVMVMSIPYLGVKDTADILRWIFMVFPHFSLAMGLNNIYVNSATREVCLSGEIGLMPDGLRCQILPTCCTFESFFGWNSPGVGAELMYMLITALIFFLQNIARDYGLLKKLYYKIRKQAMTPPPAPEDGYFDEDVDAERRQILQFNSQQMAQQNLVLDRVTKYYDKFLAVNQVSLCVKPSECFGLLGVNGAGKTTTFKMMTGDEPLTFGSAFVRGMSLESQMNDIYKEIGYCPQFDALLDDLTGRETLKIFCLLRGVSNERIGNLSLHLAKSFGFMKHMDKETKAYSGGNKRKLSTAIAIIGSPSVIYLDEPTTGMDPAARRQLWNMLCHIRDIGKSIVLTSHSMEECEALCTRLAIMVNGEFKCIGSTQHLKNKFSKGLILKIKVKGKASGERQSVMIRTSFEYRASTSPDNVQEVKQFVEKEFPQAILQEEYQGILTFYIPLSSIRWSKIFGLMEKNREHLDIEDYSISQTTLEEIFLDFAKYQREDTRATNSSGGCCSCFRRKE